MWCDRCQQDVPGLASADGKGFGCPRCGGGLCADSSGPTVDPALQRAEPTGKGDSAPPPYDSWELDQRLRHIERVLGVGKADHDRWQGTSGQGSARLDPPHAGPLPRHVPPSARSPRPPEPSPARSRDGQTAFTWPALLLGTMTFVCGGVLLGWSLVTDRPELWTIGMPIALVGQIALLVGLLLKFDRLWRDNRRAAAKLDDVDEQLHQLRTAARMSHTSHSSPSGAFYSHLVDGASPQLLLTDLKSQLDLLTLKISVNDEMST